LRLRSTAGATIEGARYRKCFLRPLVAGAEDFNVGVAMLYTIAVVLFILWILGFGVFHVAGALIHILLVAAIITVLWSLIAGRRTV
jgi:Family of unknown function (DUF5670)